MMWRVAAAMPLAVPPIADGDRPVDQLVAHRARPQTPLVPDVRDAPLLADAGLILEPQLDPLGLRMGGRYLGAALGQVFLNGSCSARLAARGCTGRAFCHDRFRLLTRRSIPVAL